MPLYRYKVCDNSGKISDITIEGDSQKDAVRRIGMRNLRPLECKGEAAVNQSGGMASSLFKRHGFDYYDFTDNLVPLLKAHIPLEKALGMLVDSATDELSRDVALRIRKGLHEGKKLSELIRSHGSMFPRIYANLVEAGEESGALPEVMIELQRFLNERKETKEFLVTSSIYPLIILSVTLGVITLLFTVFIPRFSKVFLDMGKDLPGPTQAMVVVSHTITSLWWLWLVVVVLLVWAARSIMKGGTMKLWWDHFIVHIPVLGPLIQIMEVSRFFRTLAVLINNHVHILNSVTIASRVIGNITILETISSISSGLRGGTKLSQTLSKSRFVPKTAVQMIKVGEESGKLGRMLDQVAERYEAIMKVKIKRLLALFEPVVILFLSFIVLTVVVSIFMAILEMSDL